MNKIDKMDKSDKMDNMDKTDKINSAPYHSQTHNSVTKQNHFYIFHLTLNTM